MNNINFRKITYPGVMKNIYFISENGLVFNSLSQRYPKIFTDKDGYFRVHLNGKKYGIHRLVAWEFHPETRDINLVIDHIDGNKQNNDYRNLEWVTVKENTQRAIKMGLRDRNGEKNNLHKHSEKTIRFVLQLLSEGKSNMEIVQILSNLKDEPISTFSKKNIYALIYRLRTGYFWHDVAKKYNIPKKVKSIKIFTPGANNIFTLEQIHFICKLGSLNVRIAYILKLLNFDKDHPRYHQNYLVISDILSGRCWKNISKMYGLPAIRIKNRLNIDDDFLNELLSKNLSENEILEVFLYNDNKSKEFLKNIIHKKIQIIQRNKNIESNKDIKIFEITSK